MGNPYAHTWSPSIILWLIMFIELPIMVLVVNGHSRRADNHEEQRERRIGEMFWLWWLAFRQMAGASLLSLMFSNKGSLVAIGDGGEATCFPPQ